MLETKDLVKIYKPKKGVPVTALNKVSLKFPDTGMVFLLGKSGSGKSTLLNVLGGLDSISSGEIIIKGTSSKSFKQKHFDSYRNTYVGFIFQEYNVLNEFTVGANIALAIELQGRKAADIEVNAILKEVDLEGYGSRKPNELSGGQKQRVAIARALVKNPEIIMADEPTGALDSVTGKQVLETLKKLSEKKLVIVVSHDREFAENYADRIIELSDGEVISDVELDKNIEVNEEASDTLKYEGDKIEIPAGYHITEEDRKAINEYITRLSSESINLSVGKNTDFSKKFIKTDTSKIENKITSEFRLIKSKLPLKNAFKIGSSSLKYKRVRLVITILLSCIAFGLFGLSDTFGAYNHVKTCTNSLYDSGVEYISTAKAKKNSGYWRDYGYALSEKNISEITENTGIKMHGVYKPINTNLNFDGQINPENKLSETEYHIYNPYFSGGFATVNNEIIKDMDFKILAGTLPNGSKNEIAVSEYIYEVFKKADYFDGETYKKLQDGSKAPVYQKINSYGDLLGKILNVNNTKFTVTAIIDTDFIERYIPLTEEKEYISNADRLLDYVLYSEFNSAVAYSYAGIAMVGDGYIEKLIEKRLPISNITEGYIYFGSQNMQIDASYLARLKDVSNEKVLWLDGKNRSELGEKEFIVTTDILNIFSEDGGKDFIENEAPQEVDYTKLLEGKTEFVLDEFLYGDSEYHNTEGYKLVGVIETGEKKSNLISTVVCDEELFNKFTDGADNIYAFAVGAMPKEKSDIRNAVAYCYREDSTLRFQIQNSVTYELDSVNETLKILSKYFLYIGLAFAAFAALMLANFIATSISYKRQEIGILRAIGSRSNDVFRIFFAESFIIAMINFVLSSIGVFAATQLINYILRTNTGILITILNFGFRQVLLLFAVSILVAFAASFFPVRRIAAKKPIDAIRSR